MIYIKTPDKVCNHYGLCISLSFKDEYVIQKFITKTSRFLEAFKKILFIDFKPLIERKNSQNCCIDFYNDVIDHDEILKLAEAVATDMNMFLEIV